MDECLKIDYAKVLSQNVLFRTSSAMCFSKEYDWDFAERFFFYLFTRYLMCVPNIRAHSQNVIYVSLIEFSL